MQFQEASWERFAKTATSAIWGRASGGPHAGQIELGDRASGTRLSVSPSDLAVHAHIIGATGVGKSYFLEGMLKQLIRAGHGVCVITPHDELYRRLLKYCAHLHMTRPELGMARRVIPFDIDDGRRLIGFNPVARNARVLTFQVVALMEAIRKCWGQDSFQETPRLARWLYNTGYAVVEPELTMLQAQRLVDNKPHPLRQAIVRRITNPDIRAEWEWVMSPQFARGKDDPLESAFNRIRDFTSNEFIRLILGQWRRTLDVPSVLRERKVLLVNLDARNRMGESNRNMLGTLLVNELMAAAFARREGTRTPFYVAIDEFQQFATKDLCEILDGGRKYGIHLLLAHQLLHQLKQKDPEVYYSALTNARTKVIFGGLIDEDLDVLSKELYTGELDPNEIKNEIWQTKYAPVETTRIVRADTESETEGESYSAITHESLSDTETYIAENGVPGDVASFGVSLGSAAGSSESRSSSTSRSRSTSRVPFYEYHEYKELSNVTFRSLEEQLYARKALLKRQPRQSAAVLVPGRRVELIQTPTLRDFVVQERHLDEFRAACWESAGCFARPEEAEADITAFEARLLAPPQLELRSFKEDNGEDVHRGRRVDLGNVDDGHRGHDAHVGEVDDDDSDFDRV